MEASAVLGGMFEENHRVQNSSLARATAAGANEAAARAVSFSLAAFEAARPELAGFFSGGVDVPCVVAGGGGAGAESGDGACFGVTWDADARRVRVAAAVPSAAERTAAEMCKALQHAALARDDPRGGLPPTDLLSTRVVATCVAWRYAHACLDAQQAVGRLLCGAEEEELFAAFGGSGGGGSANACDADDGEDALLGRVVDALARWDDEAAAASKAKLRGLSPATYCARDLVPSHEAKPLVPTAYCVVERLRQRLLRAAVEGEADRAVAAAQKALLKALARAAGGGGGEAAARAAAQTYLPYPVSTAVAVLTMRPEEVRGAALLKLFHLEAVMAEVAAARASAAAATLSC